LHKSDAKDRRDELREKTQAKEQAPQSSSFSKKPIGNKTVPANNYRSNQDRDRADGERERDRQREKDRDRERDQERHRDHDRQRGNERREAFDPKSKPQKHCTFCNVDGHVNEACFGPNNPDQKTRDENKRKFDERKKSREGSKR